LERTGHRLRLMSEGIDDVDKSASKCPSARCRSTKTLDSYMRYQFFWMPVLLAVASNDSLAKCGGSHPTVRAEVRVESCVGVTFEPSNLKVEVPDGKVLPWYEAKSGYSGTLLSVQVVNSHFTEPSDVASGTHLWTSGEKISLFVDRPSIEACPSMRYQSITVETHYLCCDIWPISGKCLVPESIVRVVLPPS
jgi:hypothetical protein